MARWGRAAATPHLSAPPRLVFRWDLDKTYLLSEFNSLRGLVKIPFEKAEDKVAAPGVAALMRSVRESVLGRGQEVRVYFISASPPQIGRAVRRKLELDGIVYDGIVFKDQLQRLFRGKFRHLREQVGFKLTELLRARRAEPVAAREYLFGDDWESDPLIYSLYADVVAGRVPPGELAALLQQIGVDSPLVDEAHALAFDLPRADAVARIFINLERPTPPAALRPYGTRLVPTFNYLQTAACLHAEGVLSLAGVDAVLRSLRDESAYAPSQLINSLDDVVRRGHLDRAAAARLREVVAPADRPARGRLRRWLARLIAGRRRGPTRAPAAPFPVDYRALIGGEEADNQ